MLRSSTRLSKTCGVREYLSGLRAEAPCVPPPLRGTQGVSFSCILGLKELDDSSVTLSLTYWCGNNAWAAAALCFGLEDRRGRHRLTPHNFCERHPAKWRGAFCYARTPWFYGAQIWGGARPVTKPLAGRAGARIVGTISGTARRPRPINSAVHSATNSTGGSERRRYTPHTTQPPMVHRQLSIHPHTPMYPANRPRAKDQR